MRLLLTRIQWGLLKSVTPFNIIYYRVGPMEIHLVTVLSLDTMTLKKLSGLERSRT